MRAIAIVGTSPKGKKRLHLSHFHRIIGINEAVRFQSDITDVMVLDERAIPKMWGSVVPERHRMLLSLQSMNYLLGPECPGDVSDRIFRCRMEVFRTVNRPTDCEGWLLAGPAGTALSALDYARRFAGALEAHLFGCDFEDPEATPERLALLRDMDGLLRRAIDYGAFAGMTIFWKGERWATSRASARGPKLRGISAEIRATERSTGSEKS